MNAYENIDKNIVFKREEGRTTGHKAGLRNRVDWTPGIWITNAIGSRANSLNTIKPISVDAKRSS